MKINSCLLFALLVLLLSYALAVNISKQETTTGKAKDADANKVEAKGDEGKYGVNYGGGGGNYGGGGGNYGGGGGGWGGGCRHGCCYRGHGGSCNRCCVSPEEAKAFVENQGAAKEDANAYKVEAKGDEGNYGVNYGGGGGGGNYGGGGGNYGGGGGGWGGGCRHGCCYRGHGGSCNRCCASAEEAKAFVGNPAEAKDAAGTHKVEAKGEETKYGVNYGGGGGNYGGGGGNYGGGGGNYGGGGGGWGGGCRHGCCYRGHGGSCNRCCASPEEAKAFVENQGAAKEDANAQVEAKGEEGNYGVNYGGGGGNYGGGGGNYGGGGGGWGGGCRHGCCYRGYGGNCNKCCSSPEEAKAVAENQSHP
ncbi:hypothetical protein L2E82_25480 [Cichorium intybus]|uniref:Uncharacterized protein n=1 Tax=Cichorium intybus TaxID=13427 RepID=A0ACB9E356_CICIN|nr:hypothetical protein L2E82_25480 [Cichorium intybus]